MSRARLPTQPAAPGVWRREGAGPPLAAPGPAAPRPPQAASGAAARVAGHRSLRRPRWRRRDPPGLGSAPAVRSEQVGTAEPAGAGKAPALEAGSAGHTAPSQGV